MSEEIITIRKCDYVNLVSDQQMLLALQGAGVNKWEGYDVAMDLLDEWFGNGRLK